MEFTSRVEAICKWETRRVRGLRKLMRNIYTPDHVEALLQSIHSIGQESTGVFERLDPPPGLEEEAETLLHVLHTENHFTERMRAAAQRRDYGALLEAAKRFGIVAGRVGPAMRDLGVTDCDPAQRAGISEGDIIEA
jgi:hypothetical protein